MLNTQEPIKESQKYFSIRKKHFFIGTVLLVAIVIIVLRYLLLHGFYVGFVPPPQPAAPLSPELVSRFNQIEDQLNKSIKDINEVFQYKEKLEKIMPPPKGSANKSGNGGPYLPMATLNLVVDNYAVDSSFNQIESSLAIINSQTPLLKKELTEGMYLQSNLPQGVPLVGQYIVSSGFGTRDDPFTLKESFHSGVDFSADEGTPVLAASNGVVRKTNANSDNSGFGNYIEIAHPKGIVTLYGHLLEIKVALNQVVKKGDLIGLVGSTGRSTGPHLHFEVQVAGVPVDPMDVISPIAIKPNSASMSALKSEARSKCAPLLLIVKDENAKIFKDCLAAKGSNAKELLVAKQTELSAQKPLSRPDKNALKNECVRIDASGRIQTDNCPPETSKEN
jgi:murein DD-endopeptidase MepM/ murein hydrolase activator NlpD